MFVKAKRTEQLKAREMRAAGSSLREIARELDVALSSVSVWTRGIVADQPIREAAEPARMHDDMPAERRRCSRCGETKQLTDFNRHREGRQWWCRACFSAYYQADRQRHRARGDRLLASRMAEARRHVGSILAGSACTDCGLRDPVVLEFDHLDEERRDISVMISRGAKIPALDAEIAKCQIVCANCHRRRTAVRAGWRRLDLGVSRPFRSRAQERNFLLCYCVLLASGCVDCRLLDLCVLDFDHQREKTLSVTRMAQREVGLERLTAEIRKCEVRCANCHRRRTAESRARFATPDDADTPNGVRTRDLRLERAAC